jgi:hypothetical protein
VSPVAARTMLGTLRRSGAVREITGREAFRLYAAGH